MADDISRRLPEFSPDDVDSCGDEWLEWKKDFMVHLDARGLYDKPGRQKVGKLLECMTEQSSHVRLALLCFHFVNWRKGGHQTGNLQSCLFGVFELNTFMISCRHLFF